MLGWKWKKTVQYQGNDGLRRVEGRTPGKDPSLICMIGGMEDQPAN